MDKLLHNIFALCDRRSSFCCVNVWFENFHPPTPTPTLSLRSISACLSVSVWPKLNGRISPPLLTHTTRLTQCAVKFGQRTSSQR